MGTYSILSAVTCEFLNALLVEQIQVVISLQQVQLGAANGSMHLHFHVLYSFETSMYTQIVRGKVPNVVFELRPVGMIVYFPKKSPSNSFWSVTNSNGCPNRQE